MSEQEYFLAWCDVQRLVDDALGLALLGNFDAASVINNPKDQERARACIHGALLILMKQAQPLLESMDPYRFTFKAAREQKS